MTKEKRKSPARVTKSRARWLRRERTAARLAAFALKRSESWDALITV